MTNPASNSLKAAELVLVYRPVASLTPYARNPRKNDKVVDRMVASIREFGFTVPVLITSDGTVIDGHLRLKAAQEMGIADVPVILCDTWTPAQIKAFRLLANRSVGWAEWDMELLALEMADLKEFDYDLGLTGFNGQEINSLLSAPTLGLTDEDAAPELPARAVTVQGDFWTLGSHRLLCGDCTRSTDVERLLQGVEPNLMVTDPPYGVEYNPKWRHDTGLNNSNRIGKVANDDRADWYDAYVLFPGAVMYVWHAGVFAVAVAESIERANFTVRSQIIWGKSRFAISRGHYHWQHEPCWYAVRKGATGNWQGDRSQTTLWQIQSVDGDAAKTHHGTQKPVECMRRPIINHTNPGQAVYDPFLGSGTTIIAAETTKRACYAMDIDPAYVDVAVRRWQDFTGQQARLDSGMTFDDLREQRLGDLVEPAAGAR